MLNITEENFKLNYIDKEYSITGSLKAGHKLNESVLLFDKLEDEIIESQREKLKKIVAKKEEVSSSKQNLKPMIEFETFAQMDIRIGQIKEAEKVEGADKLLKMNVDLGFETRTIVSGIAQHFKSEELIGKRVSVLVNLAPRKIRGVESQGMILLAEEADKLSFIVPEQDLALGSVVK